ncbi:MAG: alpha/beta hydrolase-fold protein, partial [Gemmataceae bacterium]
MILVLMAALAADLRIEVTVAKGLLPKPADGRVLVILGREEGEPYRTIGDLAMTAPPVAGADADGFGPGKVAMLDGTALAFPAGTLAKVKPGRYRVQALFDHSRDIRLPGAPGNLVSGVVEADIDPAKGGVVRLELTRALPEVTERPRADLRYVKLRSEALSKFWGRDITLRAGLMLPAGWEADADRTYPLRVRVGGFGTRYHHVAGMRQAGEKDPRFLTLLLDGAGPLGDPYQVDSANHGPWGEALTRELIPHVEKAYRGNGRRVVDGASTGGWVSLALQVFYPDSFRGCWSHCPDPVDFRSFQLMDLYRDANAYVNPTGFERPSMRTIDGDTVHSVRHEVLLERVLGRGGRWELSGRDWASWNATFGPRGKPLWDGPSGTIDRSVLEHWKQYDLRLRLEAEWETIGPKLRGKVRVYVGDADEYFLNNAVERLKASLDRAKPAFEG